MANYNKSFNFRNGVQVDNDNFIVNANGLVGIGTSVPREFLDVYGTAKITGLVTTNNLYSGIATFGSVTATTFNGSASGLTGIYAIATDGWYIDSVNSGIYTSFKVGIGTTNPQYSLQVGQNPSNRNGFAVDGVTGNVNSTGITTAYNFSGFGTNISGINATNISNGTLNNSRLPQSISITGITTAYSFSGFGTDITGINATNISNGTLNNSRLPQSISITGIITATSGIITSLRSTNINNSGIATLGIVTASQIYVSGATTSFGGFFGNLTGNVTGIASTALTLSGSPNITVTNVTSSNINNTGIITSTNIISGISSVGVSTVSTRLYAESIGVGTNSPGSDIHIRRTSASSLQITSETATAIVAFGRSTAYAGSNGALRFGNTSTIQRYSTAKSLDIINYDTGNINSYLQLGSVGINTGSFHWIYGQITPNTPLMSLTYAGRLGIGVTLPTNTLHVVGTSTVTSDAYVGSNLYVGNNLNISGTLSIASLSASLTGNVTGNLTGNVNSAGISTFVKVGITTATIQKLGILNDAILYPLEVGSGSSKVVVNNDSIGISTTTILPGIGLDASRVIAVASGVGIGTTIPKSYVDFADAGTGPSDFANARFMIPPKVNTTQRNALSTVEGGLIYNITNKRLELYNGTGWVGIATIA